MASHFRGKLPKNLERDLAGVNRSLNGSAGRAVFNLIVAFDVPTSDMAEWIIRMTEIRQTGIYNATGAEDGLTMGRLLEECRTVSGSAATFIWASEKFLLDQKVGAWSEMPLWIPEDYNGIFLVNNDKAITAGLTFRPLSDTIKDTLTWDATRPSNIEWRAGLKPV